jgi:P-type Cu+ transporter
MAAAAMALSSVSVVSSSLLLRYFRKPTMDKYERDVRFRQWSQNKSNDIEVHRGIDNLRPNSKQPTSILSSIKSSRLSQIISSSIVTVKDAVIEEKKKATVLFGDQLSHDSGNEEKIELQETTL